MRLAILSFVEGVDSDSTSVARREFRPAHCAAQNANENSPQVRSQIGSREGIVPAGAATRRRVPELFVAKPPERSEGGEPNVRQLEPHLQLPASD